MTEDDEPNGWQDSILLNSQLPTTCKFGLMALTIC